MSVSDRAALERLRSDLQGTLVLEGDADYDTARLPWNLAVDQRPAAAMIACTSATSAGVATAARAGGYGVTTQPNGHGADGDLADVILIRPSRFDEIMVDAEAQLLRVGAGVNWGRALERLDGTGLIGLAGSNPEVNVVGLTINGGQSMFSRRYGIPARSIVAVELVDAAGEVRRVTDADDAELAWALRGGGGLFGVITAIELALHPGDALFGGSLAFPARNAVDVISAAYELARDVPELGLDVGMMQFPDLPLVPPPLRGQTVATVAFGIGSTGSAATAAPSTRSTPASPGSSSTRSSRAPSTVSCAAACARSAARSPMSSAPSSPPWARCTPADSSTAGCS